MTYEELPVYLQLFMLTLGMPYLFALLFVIGWAVYGSQSREDTIRRIAIGVAWTTVAGVLVNFMYINVVGRVILFGLVTFLGIGVYVLGERLTGPP